MSYSQLVEFETWTHSDVLTFLPRNLSKMDKKVTFRERPLSVVSSPTMRQSFSDLVICGLCGWRLNIPKMLSCQHTFCLSCLKSDASKKDPSSQSTAYECTTCKTVAPVKNFNDLPTNLHVDTLLEILHPSNADDHLSITRPVSWLWCSVIPPYQNESIIRPLLDNIITAFLDHRERSSQWPSVQQMRGSINHQQRIILGTIFYRCWGKVWEVAEMQALQIQLLSRVLVCSYGSVAESIARPWCADKFGSTAFAEEIGTIRGRYTLYYYLLSSSTIISFNDWHSPSSSLFIVRGAIQLLLFFSLIAYSSYNRIGCTYSNFYRSCTWTGTWDDERKTCQSGVQKISAVKVIVRKVQMTRAIKIQFPFVKNIKLLLIYDPDVIPIELISL